MNKIIRNRISKNKVGKNSRYFVGDFNKTIIPLAFVGYEMIIANSYPTRTRGLVGEFRLQIGCRSLKKWEKIFMLSLKQEQRCKSLLC